jgi:hypothetical protein
METRKQGAHGTLYRYAIEYTGENDPGCPTFTTSRWAYDAEHALDKFSGLDEGWKVLRIARMSEAPQHRWNWIKVAS